MDGILFKIIAKGEVSQHFKKGVMPVGAADILEIVVLAAYPHAFLAGGRSFVGTVFVSEKDILELVHPRVGKKQRRIVEGNQGRTGDDFVISLLEIFKKCFADLVAANQFILLFQSAARLRRVITLVMRRKYSLHRNPRCRKCRMSFRTPLGSAGSPLLP